MKDVITALKSMGRGIFSFLLKVGLYVLLLALSTTIITIIGYTLMHHFLVFLGLVFIAGMCGWFYIEYENAKAIREYEELKG